MLPSQRFWFLVRDAVSEKTDPNSRALYWSFAPVGGQIPLNENKFPEGIPLRAVSERLATEGYCNGKGQPYHPYQLQEMIADAFPDAFAAVESLTLTEQQRLALKAAFIEGRRQKRPYAVTTDEEWETRCSWRLLKRPVRRCRPWDQDDDDPGAAGVAARLSK